MSSTGTGNKNSSQKDTNTKNSNKGGGSVININASFDPETRRKIANITKISQPTLVEERKQTENKEVEHPLLSLHQSVTATTNTTTTSVSKTKSINGSHQSRSEQNPPQIQQQGKQTEVVKSSNDTSSKHPESKSSGKTTTTITTDKSSNPKTDKKMEEEQKPVTKNKPLTSTLLFKVTSTIVLLFLWLSLLQSAIHNNSSIKTNAPKALLDILAKTSAVQLTIGSFVQDFGKQVVSSVFGTSKEEVDSIHQQQINQFEKRLVIGQNLLRKYNDASGSVAACERTLYSVLDSTKEGGSGYYTQQESLSSSSISSFMTSLKVDESILVVQALLCVGEARLALHSSPLGSDEMRGAQLIQAKDIYEAAVSICMKYCCTHVMSHPGLDNVSLTN